MLFRLLILVNLVQKADRNTKIAGNEKKILIIIIIIITILLLRIQ